jgi:hypothetical protein
VNVLLPLHLQFFACAVLVTFLLWVAKLIRQHRLSLRDSLLWLLSTTAALVVTIFPSVLQWIAALLAIEVPSNALFALAFVYVLLNLLSATLAISGNASRMRRLTQECALLRAEIDELRARVDGLAGPDK